METKRNWFVYIILGIATIVSVVGIYFFVDYLFSDKVEAPNISINLPKLKSFTVCQSGTCFDTDGINNNVPVFPGCLAVDSGIICGNFTIKDNRSNATSTQK